MSVSEALIERRPRKANIPKLARQQMARLDYGVLDPESYFDRSDYAREYSILNEHLDEVWRSHQGVSRSHEANVHDQFSNNWVTLVVELFNRRREWMQAPEVRWQSSRTPLHIRQKAGSIRSMPGEERVGACIIGNAGTHTADVVESQDDWKFSPEGILQRLEDSDTSWDDRLSAVLFAETLVFDESEIPQLLKFLRRFCEDHRFSTDEDTVTSVGAAIRKYAMSLSESDFDDYAELLVPSDTDTLSHEVELELVKALGWRLTYEPFEIGEQCPRLLKVLVDLCTSYLTRRLILQRNYASTVLHGIVAVAVLESATGEFVSTHSLIETGRELRVAWFYELLSDRLAEAIASLEEYRPDLAKRLQNEVAFTA